MVGWEMKQLEDELSGKVYETATRGMFTPCPLGRTSSRTHANAVPVGTRHQGPARLAGRGTYTKVDNDPKAPSVRETHLGYHLSHPTTDDWGEVQAALNIHTTASFGLQVKNPVAPTNGQANV